MHAFRYSQLRGPCVHRLRRMLRPNVTTILESSYMSTNFILTSAEPPHFDYIRAYIRMHLK